jgi:Zn finger protein HypA/HybF involved in hydrogenase expression
MEPKKITYICKNCKYQEIKQYPANPLVKIEGLIICPECNRLSFEIQNSTYLERMKNASNL